MICHCTGVLAALWSNGGGCTDDARGMETFGGTVIHAHDFRNAREFTGKRILVVGGSYSAEDIASLCYKFGAAKIVISYRTAAIEYNFPYKIAQHPAIDRVEGNTVHFVDGQSDVVDAIIFATGYKLKFPFMPGHLTLKCGNSINPPNLYRGVEWCDEHDTTQGRLFYMAMCDQSYTFTLFKMQTMWAVASIKGLIEAKSTAEKLQDIQMFEETLKALPETCLKKANFQNMYMKVYAKDLNYDVDLDVMEQFKEFVALKYANVLTYRNKGQHCSNYVDTDKPSPKMAKEWLHITDDSLEYFKNVLCDTGDEESDSINGVSH